MMLYIVIATILFFTISVMGVYVLLKDPKDKIHIEFFIIFTIQSVLLALTILMQALDNEKQVVSIYIYGSALSVFIFYLAVLTSIQLSKIIKLRTFHSVLLFIPCIPAAIDISIVPSFLEIVHSNNAWRIAKFHIDKTPYFFFAFYSLYTLLYVFFNMIWYKKSDQNKEKKQSLILIFTFLVPMVISAVHFGADKVPFSQIGFDLVGASGLLYSIWTIGIFICLYRYRFLSMTPQLVSHEVFSAIDESIILLDARYSLANLNAKAEAILEQCTKDLKGAGIERFILEHRVIRHELENIKSGLIKDFVCRINFISNAKEKILMDAKCMLAKDKFNDIVGYIIIAKEVMELKQLQYFYKITDREANVIQLVIAGHTNLEVAKNLDITERTVKSHITNIFNKLGVDNRVQLIILLKEFNLIPEKQADKLLFIRQ